ncbi:DUF4339 domain-containing protein [Akkermansiaceae bacterium]|nr:DUF4339 domain-containing protein [Akkermansiaceae bacterium]
MKEWHYISKGKQIGPASSEELINKKNSGEIAPTDLVWTDGMAEWLPFMEVADLGRSGLQPEQTSEGCITRKVQDAIPHIVNRECQFFAATPKGIQGALEQIFGDEAGEAPL